VVNPYAHAGGSAALAVSAVAMMAATADVSTNAERFMLIKLSSLAGGAANVP
jgi:hypothetical protein